MEKKIAGPVVLTLGVFDGVHRGHQVLFKKVVRRARQLGGISVAYTFDPHPARLLAPESAPPMMMSLPQRIRAIQQCGVNRVVVQKFTRSFARLTPEQFFDRVIRRRLQASEVWVGYDFTFGHRRAGTVDRLESLGRAAGIRVRIVQPVLWRETLVSSTQIRRLLSQAKLQPAAQLLGKPYTLEGSVIRGRGIGKKILGIPTANLQPDTSPLLPEGVYATQTVVGHRHYRSVTNVGKNPTFGTGALSVESHLFRFHRSILHEKIQIEFVARIREEIKFSAPADLADQIHRDMETAQALLSGRRT